MKVGIVICPREESISKLTLVAHFSSQNSALGIAGTDDGDSWRGFNAGGGSEGDH